ncbi:hypothetical protein KSP40_PGU017476 [Platanthera guangdongensis]|uniref:U5 small nuclear ribonucleoprotein TSSC4 n=1 Tax=Platanthera guangdongensis TaxID=2320717 RepID=A0ABR2LDQ9_9ASPA
MEDSFELRVKRLFGSQLFQSVPGSSFPSSSWSVVDGEVERREWNRERGLGPDRSEDPCSSDFADGGCFSKKRRSRRSSTGDFELDFDELDDDIDAAEGRRDDDEEEEEDGRGEEVDGDVTEIRSSIGLDPTLDNEKIWKQPTRSTAGRSPSVYGCRHKRHMEATDEIGAGSSQSRRNNRTVLLPQKKTRTGAAPAATIECFNSCNYLSLTLNNMNVVMILVDKELKEQIFEDEEDEYDRAALGGGASERSERLYMSDVKNHGPHLNYHSIFEDTEDDPYNGSHDFLKDPRADHLAAATRIGEDQKAAENFPVQNYGKADLAIEDIQLKPILKRKELLDDSKPKKRVRFNHAAKAYNDLKATAVDPNSIMFDESVGLPDYIRNPSKYTCYTFEDYEDSNLANKRAFEDFRNLHKKSNSEEQQHQQQQHMDEEELPKSITFNPRRKSHDVVPVNNDFRDARESDPGVARSAHIAAGESIRVGVSRIDEIATEETPMDTETPCENERVGSSRRGRQYRAMITTSSDV